MLRVVATVRLGGSLDSSLVKPITAMVCLECFLERLAKVIDSVSRVPDA